MSELRVIPLVARYRRWALDVPEGVMRRDWRLHPLRLYRARCFQRDSRRGVVRLVAREVLGLPPRFERVSAVPWGHRGNDRPLPVRP